MEWLLPILLLTALLLSVGLSVWQTKKYTADVNAIALSHNAPGRHLVSGRGKGRLRGAVVVLVVDSASQDVVAASVMAGATVVARLRPAPHLVGPVATIAERTTDVQVRRAIEDALTRLKSLRGQRDTSLSSVAPGADRQQDRVRVTRRATPMPRAGGGETPRS